MRDDPRPVGEPSHGCFVFVRRLRRRPTAQARGGALACLFPCLLVSLFVSAGHAHVVVGTKSLHLRVAGADLVVHARVVDPQAFVVLSPQESGASEAPDGRERRRPLIEVRVLETLKGRVDSPSLRLAQHGHGVAQYRRGDEVLLFLERIEKSRELAMLAGVPGGPTHVSTQEHDEAFQVEPPHGATLLAATRAIVASETAATAEERMALVRRATLDLLVSGDPMLGASALASLVVAPEAALVTPNDLPRLEVFLEDPDVSVGLRAGVLAELERRGLVDGPLRWVALLESARPSERPAAIRAVGAHASAPVQARLLRMLGEGEPSIAAEAAIALGRPGNVAAVDPLSDALAKGPPRLRRAAIRGLGAIGGSEALATLERAARSHPDAKTRRLAAAEADLVVRRGRR